MPVFKELHIILNKSGKNILVYEHKGACDIFL